MHIDKTYVYQGGDHDPDRLFSSKDVTDEVRAYAADQMHNDLERMWESLRLTETLDMRQAATARPPTGVLSLDTAIKMSLNTRLGSCPD